jgi:ATP-binding cassette subfamily B protein/subfamily B ATP-binding cassette protein MsbA
MTDEADATASEARSVLRPVVRTLWPYRSALAAAFALILLVAIGELLKPWPLKIIVDSVLGGHDTPIGFLGRLSREELLVACCAALVGIHVAMAGIAYFSNDITITIGQRMVNDLRSRAYEHLQRLSLDYHSKRRVGDLVYRLTTDAYAIQTLTMNVVFPGLSSTIFLVGMALILVWIDPVLAVIALAVVPLLYGSIRLLSAHIQRHSMEARQHESDVLSIAQNGLAAIRVVQAFTREGEEHRRFIERSETSLGARRKVYLAQTLYTGIVGSTVAMATAVVLYLGASRVLAGTVSVGEILVFLSYLSSLYQPIFAMSRTLGVFHESSAGVRRLLEILDEPETVRGGTRKLRRSQVRGDIRIENVSFAYDGRRDALRDVSLAIPAGSSVALVGPSGACKTTLVSLLPRFYDPRIGRILLDGVDLRDIDLRSLRESIAMVLQPPIVFPTTLRENVAYGRAGATVEEIAAAAEAAQLGPLLSRLPEGLDTPIGEGGATLSEGERLRLTIARALLRNAPVLILDEPTASLDSQTESLLMDGLRRLVHGRTTILIAHRLSTVRMADQIVVLREGHVVERGTQRSLFEQKGLFAELARLQQGPQPAIVAGATLPSPTG